MQHPSNICMNATSNICMNTTCNICMKTASNVCMNAASNKMQGGDVGGADANHFTLDFSHPPSSNMSNGWYLGTARVHFDVT